MIMSKNILKVKNAHKRDEFIRFYNKGHKYEITIDPKSKYTSVTTWNHNHFPKFDADAIITNMMKGSNWNSSNKYWGMTPEQIKESWNKNGSAAADNGTMLHEDIECFMNNASLKYVSYTHDDLTKVDATTSNNSIEWNYFKNFVKDHPELKPYRTEWMIYDEDLKLAGSIDMVYENLDGTLSIYDWKRTKELPKTHDWNKCALNPLIAHLPDTKYWHYALQLNTYRKILERKYDKVITKLCLVRLHPDADCKNYELLEVPILDDEISKLFEQRQNEMSKTT